ncbi:Chorismate synthase [Actinidia chinensis var. chinensis]|uniref:chorismate synthase n=1 Tax=Actinidia chinensis var. chinensis TaxID=1590841 RepID=A0A2R6PZH5_ACTCC|nr:Chorismate synthase [Actinidia chinensis var. chinensis]
MASSLPTQKFLGVPSSHLRSLHGSDLRKFSSQNLQFFNCRSHPKKLEIRAVGNTFGNYFRVSTYGESHGGGVGCLIDGCPPRIPLSEEDMQVELDRRRPGQSRITTPRKESDKCKIYSGVAEGVTTGYPIMVKVPNTDQRGHDYSEMSLSYRPSHADATYDFKYGVRSVQGGGRSSARETIGRVAAGAVAKKILKLFSGTEILAYVSQVHNVVLPEDLVDHQSLTFDQVITTLHYHPPPPPPHTHNTWRNNKHENSFQANFYHFKETKYSY